MKRPLRPGWAFSLFCSLSLSTALCARIEPVPGIEALANSAPVIVVGYVADIRDAGAEGSWTETLTWTDGRHYPVARKVATVRVAEVLKGDVASPSIRIAFDENLGGDAGPPIWSLSKGDHRIFFLRSGADAFTFSDSHQYAMPIAGDPGAVPPIAENSVYAKVIERIAASLFSLQVASQDREMALFRISTEPSPLVTEILRRAFENPVASADTDLRFNLLAALVRRKDETVLPDFETALFSTQEARFNSARSNMVLALQEQKPVVAVPLLIRALRDQQPAVRLTAAEAIEHSHNGDAVAALLRAVDDPEPEVQWQVIAALESILNRNHCLPSSPDQREALATCVDAWRESAAKTGDANRASNPLH